MKKGLYIQEQVNRFNYLLRGRLNEENISDLAVSAIAGVTATAAELNILDGATLSTAELNILDGVTATAAELNIMDGVTATAAEINRVADISNRVVNVTTTPLAVTAASHDSKIITLNKSDGIAITLPEASGSGTKLHFIIGTTITLNTTTIKVTGNDVMTGNAIICNDTDASVSGFETAVDSDTITFDGSTTGGIKGDSIELMDIASDLWFVRIIGSATSSEVTPFSATVT